MATYKTLFVAIITFATAASSWAQTDSWAISDRSITAVGGAEMEVASDLATINFNVITKGPTSVAAREANAVASKSILDALGLEYRLEKTDYRNSVTDTDDTVFDKETQQRKPIGRLAINSVVVRTKALDKVGQIEDLIVSKGGSIQYSSFGLQNPQAAKAAALAQASMNAQENAQASLKPFGLTVGRVLGISQSAEAPVRRFAANERAFAAAAPSGSISTQVNAGVVTVSASVTVLFEIK